MKIKKITISLILILSLSLMSCSLKEGPEGPAITNWLGLESVENARQVGSFPILRSGDLSSLSTEDMDILANKYKLAYVIDLRDEVERTNYPDRIIEGVIYKHLDLWPREVRLGHIEKSTSLQGFDGEAFIKNYYTHYALDSNSIEIYKEIFDLLLENEKGSILIHCTYGKDRTGVVTSLFLLALGLEWNQIEEEYLLSNLAYPNSVRISSHNYFKDAVEENYGTIDNYLREAIKLDDDKLASLRMKYLG